MCTAEPLTLPCRTCGPSTLTWQGPESVWALGLEANPTIPIWVGDLPVWGIPASRFAPWQAEFLAGKEKEAARCPAPLPPAPWGAVLLGFRSRQPVGVLGPSTLAIFTRR